jgi:HAD superfamily hydrolase (TIGR01509 family)
MIYAEYGLELALRLWQRAPGSNRSFDAVAHLVTLLEQGPTPERAHMLDHAEVRVRRQKLKQRLSADQPLLPGVLSKLDEARTLGLPCAVASSSGRDWVAGWLERHAIHERFVCVYTGDDVAATKPAPDLFLSAAAGLERPPEQCLVFEDSSNGILTAHAAGMRAVAVPSAISRHFDLPPADLVLPALDALPLEMVLHQLDNG